MIENDEFIVAYNKLNSHSDNVLIYPLTDRGFTSELNKLLLTILFCLTHKRKLVLYDQSWNAGSWVDYYHPICPSFKPLLKMPNYIFNSNGKYKLLYKSLHRFLYSKYEVIESERWKEINSGEWLDKHFFFPSLKIDGDCFHALQVLEQKLFIYNEETAQYVSSHLKEFNFKELLGIHVRRGDKLVREASSFSVDSYLKKVQNQLHHFKMVFIATDNYDTVKELEKLNTEFTTVTFCEKVKTGHDQKTFNFQDIDSKISQNRDLLLEIEVLAKCQAFVGTFSSNIGRFVHLKRCGKNSYSLDQEWHV